MSSSSLKPSKNDLELNLDQYRMGSGAELSDLEFSIIGEVCRRSDKAIRLATRIAITELPSHLKYNLFPTLTAGDSLSPKATKVGSGEAYRISIPITFIARLFTLAPVRENSPKDASDFLISTTIVAVLAAYGHELAHVFTGHLETQSSLAQETYADYIGGGLLWAWLHDKNISLQCNIPDGEQASMCAYGFLQLISSMNDLEDTSLYLPRCLRFTIFSGGAAFYADNSVGICQGDLVGHAFKNMPVCPIKGFDSLKVRYQHKILTSQLQQPQMISKLRQVFELIEKEKKSWYSSAKHLGPIKKTLSKMLKRRSQ